MAEAKGELQQLYSARHGHDDWAKRVREDAKIFHRENTMRQELEFAKQKALKDDLKKQMASRDSLKTRYVDEVTQEKRVQKDLADSYQMERAQRRQQDRSKTLKQREDCAAQLQEVSARRERERQEDEEYARRMVEKAKREMEEEKQAQQHKREEQRQRSKAMLVENAHLKFDKIRAKASEAERVPAQSINDSLDRGRREFERDQIDRQQRSSPRGTTFVPFGSTSKKYDDYFASCSVPKLPGLVESTTPRTKRGSSKVPTPPPAPSLSPRERRDLVVAERMLLDSETQFYAEQENQAKISRRKANLQHRAELEKQMREKYHKEMLNQLTTPKI